MERTGVRLEATDLVLVLRGTSCRVDTGRPTLSLVGVPRGHTLVLTLRDRQTGRVFISEMKCELEYEGYRYLRLADARQLDHHRGEAFQKFLKMSRDPHAFHVRNR